MEVSSLTPHSQSSIPTSPTASTYDYKSLINLLYDICGVCNLSLQCNIYILYCGHCVHQQCIPLCQNKNHNHIICPYKCHIRSSSHTSSTCSSSSSSYTYHPPTRLFIDPYDILLSILQPYDIDNQEEHTTIIQRHHEVQQQHNTLKHEITLYEEQIREVEQSMNHLHTECRTYTDRITEMTQKHTHLLRDITHHRTSLLKMKHRYAELKQSLEKWKDEVKDLHIHGKSKGKNDEGKPENPQYTEWYDFLKQLPAGEEERWHDAASQLHHSSTSTSPHHTDGASLHDLSTLDTLRKRYERMIHSIDMGQSELDVNYKIYEEELRTHEKMYQSETHRLEEMTNELQYIEACILYENQRAEMLDKLEALIHQHKKRTEVSDDFDKSVSMSHHDDDSVKENEDTRLLSSEQEQGSSKARNPFANTASGASNGDITSSTVTPLQHPHPHRHRHTTPDVSWNTRSFPLTRLNTAPSKSLLVNSKNRLRQALDAMDHISKQEFDRFKVKSFDSSYK